MRAGSTALSPRKALETVLGLTPAARATSLSVIRPVDRWLFKAVLAGTGALGKGLSGEGFRLKVDRIALSKNFVQGFSKLFSKPDSLTIYSYFRFQFFLFFWTALSKIIF
jgi:hypothetical protein